jgi:hypothetical protein
MAAGKERDEDLVDHVGLPDDDAAHFGADALDGAAELGDGRLGIVEDRTFLGDGAARRRDRFRRDDARNGNGARNDGGSLGDDNAIVGELELRAADGEARARFELKLSGRLIVDLQRTLGVVGGDAPVALVLGEIGVMRQHGGIAHDDMARGVRADDERFAVQGNDRVRLMRDADDEGFSHKKETGEASVNAWRRTSKYSCRAGWRCPRDRQWPWDTRSAPSRPRGRWDCR